MNDSVNNDPYELSRFLNAQNDVFDQVMTELRAGRKQSHWMWFIFPQFDGLAYSATSKHFAIKSLDEARAFVNHPVLGPRLQECAQTILQIEGRSIDQILSPPDDLKLKSCATLFASVLPSGSIFDRIIDKYYRGARDDRTLRLLGKQTLP